RRPALHARGRRVLRGVRRDRRRPGADAGRVGRRVPHRRAGAEDARRAAALRLPPALRAQGTVLAEHGAGAVDGRAASACGPAGRRGDGVPRDATPRGSGMTTPTANGTQAAARAERHRFHDYESPTQWTWAAA